MLNLATPANATIADASGTGTILDDDTTVTQAGLFVSDTAVAEGNSGTRAANFTVSLTSPATSEVKVDYATTDGTATTADGDYQPTSGTLTFAAGETSKTVAVQVNGDTKFEPDETFTLNLSNPRGAPVSRGTGTGTIVNDDTRRLKLRGLSFTVTPARDRTAPFRFTVRGKLLLPSGVSRASGCGTGTVRVRFTAAGRTVSSRSTQVTSSCRFRLVTTFRDARGLGTGRLRVQARFSGNAALLPFAAPTKGARAG
jgi:hypothetical protein